MVEIRGNTAACRLDGKNPLLCVSKTGGFVVWQAAKGNACRKNLFQTFESFFAARMQFFISIATVMGPTPPGTGVIAEAFFAASS